MESSGEATRLTAVRVKPESNSARDRSACADSGEAPRSRLDPCQYAMGMPDTAPLSVTHVARRLKAPAKRRSSDRRTPARAYPSMAEDSETKT